MKVRSENRKGFTLIEMLVVIAIIALLASIIIPTVSKSIEKAKRVKCVGNLRSIAQASRMYGLEHEGIIIPSRYEDKRPGGGGEAIFWNSALLEFYNRKTNETNTREMFSCTNWEEVGENYTNWNWGYAINDNPLYDEDDTKPDKSNIRMVIESDGTVKGNYVYMSRIENPSRRLHFCCANQWHVNNKQVDEDFPDYDRHGNQQCNVAFFDGHVESLNREQIVKAVRNP